MANNSYQLVVRNAPQSGLTPGQVIALEQSVLTLGRDPLSDIILDDPEVSRHHAKLILQAEGYEVQDMGSTNGTFVDGQRLGGEPLALKPGQVIMLGTNVTMVYQATMVEAEVDPLATVVAAMAAAEPEPSSVEEDAEEVAQDDDLVLPGTAPTEDEFEALEEVEEVAADAAQEEDQEMATIMDDSPIGAPFPDVTPEPEPLPELPPEPEPVTMEPVSEPFPVPEPPAATFDNLDERTYIDSAAPVSDYVEEPLSQSPPPPELDEPEKKDSNRNLIIVAVVVVLLICCCLAIFAGVALGTDLFGNLF